MDDQQYDTLFEELSGYSIKDVYCSNRVGNNQVMIAFEDETTIIVPEAIWNAFFKGELKKKADEVSATVQFVDLFLIGLF